MKNDILCNECKNIIKGTFVHCYTCDINLCCKCVKKHLEHDIVPMMENNNEVSALKCIKTGAGPDRHDWFMLDLDVLDNREKCEHAMNNLQKNKLIFYCYGCGKYMCHKCLEKHDQSHNIELDTLIDDKLRQNVPYVYDTNLDLYFKLIYPNVLNYSNDIEIPLTLNFKNTNLVPLYNIIVIYNFESDENDIKVGEIADKIRIINPDEEKIIESSINIKNPTNPFSMTLIIFYQDIYGGESHFTKELSLYLKNDF